MTRSTRKLGKYNLKQVKKAKEEDVVKISQEWDFDAQIVCSSWKGGYMEANLQGKWGLKKELMGKKLMSVYLDMLLKSTVAEIREQIW